MSCDQELANEWARCASYITIQIVFGVKIGFNRSLARSSHMVRINYTGTQVTQWDFQNKGKSSWTGTSSFVLEVPLRNLCPSVIYSVPCDRIVQRAYSVFQDQSRSQDLSSLPPLVVGIKTLVAAGHVITQNLGGKKNLLGGRGGKVF